MSILSSLVHHEIHDLPNAVHNTQDSCKPESVLSSEAKKHLTAMKEKSVRPAMYYSEDVRRPYKNGAWQNAHAVESEVELREETPRG